MQIMKTLIIPLLVLLSTWTLSAQSSVTLSGKVFDSGTQNPLPECNVYLSDFNYGTITDSLGNYILRIPAVETDQYLIISYVGYLKYSIKISEITSMPFIIYMNPEIKMLDEIIVRGEKGISLYDISDIPWNYREIDQDYAKPESPEIFLSSNPR